MSCQQKPQTACKHHVQSEATFVEAVCKLHPVFRVVFLLEAGREVLARSLRQADVVIVVGVVEREHEHTLLLQARHSRGLL